MDSKRSNTSATSHREFGFKVPPLIKRNTILLAGSQACVGTGNQMVPTLGAIIVVNLLGSATFAGVGTSILGISRTLAAYPAGKLTDTYGRRVGLLAGLTVIMAGAVVTGFSVVFSSFLLFLVGVLIFGLGVGAMQQLRLAAAEMYPPSLRGLGLGLVLTGSLVGALGGPLLIKAAQTASSSLAIDPTALAWIFVPAVILPSMLLVLLIRPDPLMIARNLQAYYPNYTPAAEPLSRGSGSRKGLTSFFGHYPKLVAFTAMSAAQGTMMMMMALTALVLSHHGHDLTSISLAVTIHVVGMFGLSLPLGRLADRVGRRRVMIAGLVLCGAGAMGVPLTPNYWGVTLGIFLVGLGWSCVNVASSALIVDTTSIEERGRTIGAFDTFSTASGILLPLIGGAIAQFLGLLYVGILGLALMVVPFILLLRLREYSLGKYEQEPATAAN